MRTFELHRHPHVLRFGAQICQAIPQRVRPEFFDHVDRIDAVPLRLRHRFAIAIQDLGMNEDLAERHVPHVVQPGEHHPRDPQGDDVAAGDQHAGRIKVFRAPAVCSGQPSVECGHSAELNQVSSTSGSCNSGSASLTPSAFAAASSAFGGKILFQRHRLAIRSDSPADDPCNVVAAGERAFEYRLRGHVCIPNGNSMSPPQLATHRPIAFFAQPIQISLRITGGKDLDAAVGHRVHRRLSQLRPSSRTIDRRGTARSASCCGRSEPNQFRDPRPPPANPALPNRRRLDAAPPELSDPRSGPAFAFSVPSGFRILIAPISFVPLPHFVIIRIMCGRDLDATASEFRLRPCVGDQRNLTIEQWQPNLPAVMRHVAQRFELGQHR